MPDIRTSSYRGWEIVHLRSDVVEVEVVPGKGADVTSVRWLPLDVDVMWHTRWGLRHHGQRATLGSSEALLMDAYPGGWQTVFPNGGDATTEHGVEWGMHGEAWLASYDWAADESAPGASVAIELRAELVRSPFVVTKRIALDGAALSVTETVTNTSPAPVEVMWSQHPAFGAPLLAPGARVETSATTVRTEDGEAPWPTLPESTESRLALDEIPPARSGVSRMGYLDGFAGDEARAAIVNPALGLRAELSWDASEFPYAWYWFEAGGRAGFPWFSDAYVLAIEPATSWPGRGIAVARETTGTQVLIGPDATVSKGVTLTLAAAS